MESSEKRCNDNSVSCEFIWIRIGNWPILSCVLFSSIRLGLGLGLYLVSGWLCTRIYTTLSLSPCSAFSRRTHADHRVYNSALTRSRVRFRNSADTKRDAATRWKPSSLFGFFRSCWCCKRRLRSRQNSRCKNAMRRRKRQARVTAIPAVAHS